MHNLLHKLRERRAEGDSSDKGFTLIELLVVVVIIGILIAIAIPLYLNYEKGAKDKSAQSDVRGAVSVLEQCNTDNSTYPTVMTTAGVMTGCAGQTVNLSSGTKVTYTYTAGPPQSYMIVGKNDDGSGKSYCYNSLHGGSVASGTTC